MVREGEADETNVGPACSACRTWQMQEEAIRARLGVVSFAMMHLPAAMWAFLHASVGGRTAVVWRELWGCAEAQRSPGPPGSIGAACRMRAACCAQHNATYGRIVKLYGRTTRRPAARQITGLKSNAGASSAPNYRVEKQRGGQQRAKFPG
jgi:hypothetical protein